jgi:PIF1 helicase.
VFHFIGGPGGTGKSALFKKLHAACRKNGQLISICAATSLAALNFEGATTAHSLFSYPVEDETDVDDQDLATCDFKKERCDYLHEVSVIFWDEFISNDRILMEAVWKNSKRDGKNHVITFSCALVILLRYVFFHSQAFTSHQYT